MSFAGLRKSTAFDRSLAMARERVFAMTPAEVAAATPEGLVNSFGVSLDQATRLLANFKVKERRS